METVASEISTEFPGKDTHEIAPNERMHYFEKKTKPRRKVWIFEDNIFLALPRSQSGKNIILKVRMATGAKLVLGDGSAR